jgi:hypothetical protein
MFGAVKSIIVGEVVFIWGIIRGPFRVPVGVVGIIPIWVVIVVVAHANPPHVTYSITIHRHYQ